MKEVLENKMINIKLKDIIKIQYLYMDIFSEEDDDCPDERIIKSKEKAIDRILNKITDIKDKRNEIYDTITRGSWQDDSHTFKEICNKLRELGYTIIENNNKEEK